MFNSLLCNAAIIRYSQLKFRHMYLCGIDYKYFSPHCCKCNSIGCTAAIRWGNACHGAHSDSLYSGSEQCQFNSPRLVKREAGFPNPRRALIGSNQLWRVNDSPYYREYMDKLDQATAYYNKVRTVCIFFMYYVYSLFILLLCQIRHIAFITVFFWHSTIMIIRKMKYTLPQMVYTIVVSTLEYSLTFRKFIFPNFAGSL